MKYLIVSFLSLMLITSCKSKKENEEYQNKTTVITTKDYELIKVENEKALLIIFPGAGSNAKKTKEEFKIINPAIENGISVLLMNFSNKLWITDADCMQLNKELEGIMSKNKLQVDKIFIGGMSIGGNVALSLSNFLLKNNSTIKPRGVFVVDPPLDLFGLYKSSIKDIKNKDFSEERLAEPKGIINYFENTFGEEDSLLLNIQKISPFTLETKNIKNIHKLKDIKLNLYTEPDTLWWKENRQTDFESTNSYSIIKLFEVLQQNKWSNIQLIETKNKGYRSNGDKHPHSWSIVDIDNLINWMN